MWQTPFQHLSFEQLTAFDNQLILPRKKKKKGCLILILDKRASMHNFFCRWRCTRQARRAACERWEWPLHLWCQRLMTIISIEETWEFQHSFHYNSWRVISVSILITSITNRHGFTLMTVRAIHEEENGSGKDNIYNHYIHLQYNKSGI